MNIWQFIIKRFFKSKSQFSGYQFNNRPSDTIPTVRLPSIGDEPDWWKNRLFCWWGDQNMLHFGSNRKEYNKMRRLVSLKKRGIFWVVLPATGKYNPNFFGLNRTECLCLENDKPDSLYDKSYLCPRVETISPIGLIKEIGVVNHLTTPRIIEWYQQYHRLQETQQ